MAAGPFNNVAKGVRPDALMGDDTLDIEPGPGMEMDGELPHSNENVTVTEDPDGGVTVEFGDPEVEAPILGFGDNLAINIEEDELARIGSELQTLIESDDLSRKDWKSAIDDGMSLLGLTTEERTQPFQGASGVVHPVLNEAVVQFQSQAYKELLPSGGPVRTAQYGDATIEKEQQAERVRHYMNYLITEVMEEYDPDFDQMLYRVGFEGSGFKKVYYDGELERGVSPFILAKDLIVPYAARDLYTAERVTHVVTMSENTLRQAQVSGFYLDIELQPTHLVKDDIQEKTDKITGIDEQGDPESFELYECHCNIEVPGHEKMYPEGHEHAGEPTGVACPYVVTLERSTGKILAIRRNYRENDPKYRKKQYFVHYKFLPGLGFYGFGLVHLLGNIARGGTATLRQLIDAGTLANLQGGFKVKGLRVANEKDAIQPGEWRDVDAPNGNLRDALYPIPYKEPSPTLMGLLEFLIGAAEKFIGTTDLGVGDSNQELPVGSVIALLERGSRVLSSVHKRLHYAQKQELRLLAEVVAEAMPDEYPYEVSGQQRTVKKTDFDAKIDVVPVSDPNIFSMTQRISLAQEQMKLAQAAPQIHNLYEAHRRMYVALGVTDIDEVLPPPPQPKPETPAGEHAKLLGMSSSSSLKAFEQQNHQEHIVQHIAFFNCAIMVTMQPAQVGLLQHICEHIHFYAKTQVVQGDQQMLTAPLEQLPPEVVEQITAIEGQILPQILQQLVPAMPGGEDPLVALKQKELQIKEASEKAKKEQGEKDLQLEQRDQQLTKQIADDRIRSAEKIAEERLMVQMNKQKMDQQKMQHDAQMGVVQMQQDTSFKQAQLTQNAQKTAVDTSLKRQEFQRDGYEQDRQFEQAAKTTDRKFKQDDKKISTAKAKPKPKGK